MQCSKSLAVGHPQECKRQSTSSVSELLLPASLQVIVKDMSEKNRETTGQRGVSVTQLGEKNRAKEGNLAVLTR